MTLTKDEAERTTIELESKYIDASNNFCAAYIQYAAARARSTYLDPDSMVPKDVYPTMESYVEECLSQDAVQMDLEDLWQEVAKMLTTWKEHGIEY